MSNKKDKTKTKKPAKASDAGVHAAARTAVAIEDGGGADPLAWIGDWFDHLPYLRRIPMAVADELQGIGRIAVEEIAGDGETIIRAEIPGVDPDDIDVSVANGRLSICAEREQRVESKENGTRSEFRYGSFKRTMTLAPGVDPADVSATYDAGILEVHVPLDSDDAGRTKVPVSVPSSD